MLVSGCQGRSLYTSVGRAAQACTPAQAQAMATMSSTPHPRVPVRAQGMGAAALSPPSSCPLLTHGPSPRWSGKISGHLYLTQSMPMQTEGGLSYDRLLAAGDYLVMESNTSFQRHPKTVTSFPMELTEPHPLALL